MEAKTPLVGQVFGKIYKLVKKLGSGAFGDIYLCVNLKTMEEFAIKLEKADNPHPQVFFEAKLYQYLQSDSVVDRGIPKLHFSGTDNGYNIIVMDLLGSSLEDLFQKYKRKFSLRCVLQLGLQMLARIEFLHTKSFIHRDIKPDNFVMGIGKKQHQVYMIDFGLSKRYISRDKGHIPYKDGKSLTGTARYASINTHLGIEQSRRDDLESIGYVLLYFLKGQLPWQNMKATNKKDKYRQIMEKKMQTPVDQLIKGFPRQLGSYLNYCKNLRFEEKPDYVYLQNLFKEMMKENQFEFDFIYDWTSPVQPKPSVYALQSNPLIADIPTKNTLPQDYPIQTTDVINNNANQVGVVQTPEDAARQNEQLQQINKIRNTSMNNINMRTTMQSSNKFSSNRKSIENQLQTTQQIHNNNTSQQHNENSRQKQTPGYNLVGNLDSKDTFLIEEDMKGSILLRTQGVSSGYQNHRLIQMNNDINTNIYQLPSATKNPQPSNNPSSGILAGYSQNNSLMNTTKNPTLSRLQKQNQKLSELLKIQQSQSNHISSTNGKALTGGVPLPKIINHRAQIYSQFRN